MRADTAVRDDQMPALLMIVLTWLAAMFRGNDEPQKAPCTAPTRRP